MIGHGELRHVRAADPRPAHQIMAGRMTQIAAATLAVLAVVLLGSGWAIVDEWLRRDPGSAGYHRLAVDEPAPSFDLVDHERRRILLAGLAGNVVVLTFTYTNCTDICPMLTHTLDRAGATLAKEEKDRVRFIAISIDPQHDTPDRLKMFLEESGLDSGVWHLLTGSVEEIVRVASDYGVVMQPAPRGDLVHNSVFIFINPVGRQMAELHGVGTPPEVVVAEIRALLR